MEHLSITYIGENRISNCAVSDRKIYTFEKGNDYTVVPSSYKHFYELIRARPDYILTSDKENYKKWAIMRTPLLTSSMVNHTVEDDVQRANDAKVALVMKNKSRFIETQTAENFAKLVDSYRKSKKAMPDNLAEQARSQAEQDFEAELKTLKDSFIVKPTEELPEGVSPQVVWDLIEPPVVDEIIVDEPIIEESQTIISDPSIAPITDLEPVIDEPKTVFTVNDI